MVGSYKINTRLSAGRTSFKTSSRLPSKFEFNIDKPVTFPPGRAKLSTALSPTGSLWIANTIGLLIAVACSARTGCGPAVTITSKLRSSKFCCQVAQSVGTSLRPKILNRDISTVN